MILLQVIGEKVLKMSQFAFILKQFKFEISFKKKCFPQYANIDNGLICRLLICTHRNYFIRDDNKTEVARNAERALPRPSII